AIASEIIVGDKEALDVPRVIFTQNGLEVVGSAEAALAALHIDDGAERTLIRAAASEIEARKSADGPAHSRPGQDGQWLAGEVRQVVQVIIERCELALPGVAQKNIEPAVF